MKPTIAAKLDQLSRRLDELNALLSTADATRDMDQYRRLTREHAELSPVVERYGRYRAAEADLNTAAEMLGDPEMRAFAEAEATAAKDRMAELETELQRLLLPKDPDDERNIFLEIRAGTGGDEAALFAADLFRMYTRYAERQRWQVEIVSESASELGGYKEVIARIVGYGAYSRLKYESGGHRVQRVPATETQGRIHTSAATVAVMPEADPVEVELKPEDLEIKTSTSTGPGGQSVNTTYSAIRITHKPTGLVVSIQDEKSQLQNKEKALRVLRARLYEMKLAEQQEAIGAQRRGMVRSGNRSEKIRTYNFKENRVTDHRINLTLHKLDRVISGDLDELVSALITAERTAQLNGGAAAS